MSGTFLDLSFSDDENENVNEQLNISDLVFESDENGGLSDIETREDPTFSSAPELVDLQKLLLPFSKSGSNQVSQPTLNSRFLSCFSSLRKKQKPLRKLSIALPSLWKSRLSR